MEQREPIMQFFKFDHLPPEKQVVSKVFADAAEKVHELPRNPERTVALRKLLEAKDAAVRASFMVIAALLMFCVVVPHQAQANVPHASDAVMAQVDAPAPTPVVETPVASKSTFGNLLGQFLSPEGVLSLLGIIGGAIFSVVKVSDNAKRRIALGSYHAFHVVEDIAAETDTPIDNKAVPYLKALDDYFKANKWRPLKPGEQEQALLIAKQLNGEQKAQEKIQANAIAAAQKLTGNPQTAS